MAQKKTKKKDYPGAIEKRGDSYRVRLCVDRRRYYFTLKNLDRKEAEQFARNKDSELRRRSVAGLLGQMTLSQILARYREAKLSELAPNTRKTYEYSLRAILHYCTAEEKDPMAHLIRPAHVERFLEWRKNHGPGGEKRSKPLSPRSRAKDRATLHALFAYASTIEVVEANPVEKVPPPEGDTREPIILTDTEFETLLSACEGYPMLWMYVLTLGETGLRCDSEALWLRWHDVDLSKGLVTVESVRKGVRTKSGKSRKVPMTRRLRAAMRDHFAAYRMRSYGGGRTHWVFHHSVNRRRAKARERITSLRRGFEAAVRRGALPEDLHQHDLRHRRVTKWLAEGKPAHIIQKAMGHSDLRTTLYYEHLVPEDLFCLVEEPGIHTAEKTAQKPGLVALPSLLCPFCAQTKKGSLWKTTESPCFT